MPAVVLHIWLNASHAPRGFEKAEAEIGAAAGVDRKAAMVFRSLAHADLVQRPACSNVCVRVLEQGDHHVETFAGVLTDNRSDARPKAPRLALSGLSLVYVTSQSSGITVVHGAVRHRAQLVVFRRNAEAGVRSGAYPCLLSMVEEMATPSTFHWRPRRSVPSGRLVEPGQHFDDRCLNSASCCRAVALRSGQCLGDGIATLEAVNHPRVDVGRAAHSRRVAEMGGHFGHGCHDGSLAFTLR